MNGFRSNWMKNFMPKHRPLVMAHRGNRVMFPENTMAAFRQAVDDGADILETDLHLSSDEVFVCIHDATVDRTLSASGNVNDKSLKELKSLQAFGNDSSLTDETIPTLAELAEFLPQNVALALELKTDRFLEQEVCLRLGDLLSKYDVMNRSMVLSFSLERLNAVKQAVPELPVGWISMTRLIPNLPVDLIGSFWPVFFINPFYVKMAHRRGIFTCPLDPTPDTRLPCYLRLGVDAVLSDDPGKTRKEIDRLHKR
jgi:glycerophosphoryl diester phosphodiesterase